MFALGTVFEFVTVSRICYCFPAFVTVLCIGYVASPIRDSDFGITSRRRRSHVYVTRLGPNSIPDLGRRRDADICK